MNPLGEEGGLRLSSAVYAGGAALTGRGGAPTGRCARGVVAEVQPLRPEPGQPAASRLPGSLIRAVKPGSTPS